MPVTQEVTLGRPDESAESVMVSPALRQGVGRHLIAECWGCNERIFSETAIQKALEEAVRETGATLLRLFIHTFEPHGVSAVAVISESHIFIHTWPEKRYLALDAFTCGNTVPEKALEVICRYFEPQHIKSLTLVRGVPPGDERG